MVQFVFKFYFREIIVKKNTWRDKLHRKGDDKQSWEFSLRREVCDGEKGFLTNTKVIYLVIDILPLYFLSSAFNPYQM